MTKLDLAIKQLRENGDFYLEYDETSDEYSWSYAHKRIHGKIGESRIKGRRMLLRQLKKIVAYINDGHNRPNDI